jgi:uncharacterized protein (TIGR02246 family)
MKSRAEDIVAIRAVMATYNIAGDRLQLETLASTFTEDGVLEVPGANYHGRSAIKEGLAGLHRTDVTTRNDVPQPTFVRHHLTTSQIEFLADDEATGRSYFIVYTDIGADHAGVYVDKIARRGDQWFLTYRRVLIDWVSKQSRSKELREGHLARLAARAGRANG